MGLELETVRAKCDTCSVVEKGTLRELHDNGWNFTADANNDSVLASKALCYTCISQKIEKWASMADISMDAHVAKSKYSIQEALLPGDGNYLAKFPIEVPIQATVGDGVKVVGYKVVGSFCLGCKAQNLKADSLIHNFDDEGALRGRRSAEYCNGVIMLVHAEGMIEKLDELKAQVQATLDVLSTGGEMYEHAKTKLSSWTRKMKGAVDAAVLVPTTG